MYKFVYHGTNREIYSRIRKSFPKDMNLVLECDYSSLKCCFAQNSVAGVIFPLFPVSPELFSRLKKLLALPGVPAVVVVSPELNPQQAVGCMRLGVVDCITGPISGEIIVSCLRKLQPLPKQYPDRCIHGNSAAVQMLYSYIEKYSPLDVPVLITGETGSGKELAAQALHQNSKRNSGPFIAVNCGAYPDEIINTEFFGSLKGAFTGSVDRPGLFETCNNGTLFLDEIAELSLKSQTSLLRVLENQCVRRMGSSHFRPVNVRIVAATNRPLKYMIQQQAFRKDLYYRLNLLNLKVPPLRKRKEDIPVLAREYLNTLPKGNLQRFHPAAYSRLIHYKWPGNVRELQSVILKASLLAKSNIIHASDIFLDY